MPFLIKLSHMDKYMPAVYAKPMQQSLGLAVGQGEMQRQGRSLQLNQY